MTPEVTLGKQPTPLNKKDAVHVLVIPMKARTHLQRGMRVDKDGLPVTGIGPWAGVVDPFGPDLIRPDELYWLLVRPGYGITARHAWSHPDFPDPVEDPTPSEKMRTEAVILDIRNLEQSQEIARLREKIDDLESDLRRAKENTNDTDSDPACRGCY